MKYINLNLKKHDEKDANNYLLDDVIKKYEIVVLLGPPGSGKSSILEKYENDHGNSSQRFKVNKFLKLNAQIGKDTKVLLLDGLDEYRSVAADKAFIITEIGNKINELPKNIHVVISCREMDWYGETDVTALQEEINRTANLYNILPLNEIQKVELADLHKIKNPDVFIKKFSDHGFLNNPQMFKMLAKIYNDDSDKIIKSKNELYQTFIKNSREKNINYTTNKVNEIDANEFLKYAGYIAFFYMFSNIDTCDDAFVDRISDAEHGFKKEKIEIVLKTAMFTNGEFIHRTIAEFCLATFITKYKLENNQLIAVERIKNLFVKKDKVPTELRGVFAWLCSLTGREEFIKIDPYYQIIHGDNSLFDNELKKRTVLEIKEYAQKNPYFFEYRQTMNLEGFYNENLDDFFISEFKEALKLKNHYLFFIINVMISTDKLSHKIKGFLKKIILEEKKCSYKNYIIDAFRSDTCFLRDVLDYIEEGQLIDEGDSLKDAVLKILYPDHIGCIEVVKYLLLYKNYVGGYCHYLFNTEYKDKFALIDELCKRSYYETKSSTLSTPKNVKSFIEDYFLETLLKFENGLSAKEIYEVIKHFKKYYKEYEGLKFNSYRYKITDDLKNSDEKLKRLANELFALYVDDELTKNGKDIHIFSFFRFFDYISPDNRSNILFGKMSHDNSFEINKILFLSALSKDIDFKITESKAKKFKLEEVLYDWQLPPKQEWELEDEKWEKERKEEEEKILTENERHFSEKSDLQIQNNFGDLYFIAKLCFLGDEPEEGKPLKEKTLRRLKNILRNAIFAEDLINPELLTLNSLAENSPDARRTIDIMYYVSCTFNEDIDLKLTNDNFKKYLYIICLHFNESSNVRKSIFIKQIEDDRPAFAVATIKEYIGLLLDNYLENHIPLIMPYVNREDDIDKLKLLLQLFVVKQDDVQDIVLKNFLNVYNFDISYDDLNELVFIPANDENKTTILALKTISEDNKDTFSINIAIHLYSLFEHHSERFSKLENEKKVQIIDYMMCAFDTEESIKFIGGFQSHKAMCASFLTETALNSLDIESLQKLKGLHKDEDDIWSYRIANKINELEQKNADQSNISFPIGKIKNFIVSNAVISKEDFFTDICLKLEKLKTTIEDNRDNDKEPFYNQNRSPKSEENCRDVILHRLKDKYGYDIELTKEKYEGNNRADINIKYKADNHFEVQVECKRDDNSGINTGISEQLIRKYFSSGVEYGIYLIFYFGSKKNKDLLLEKIDNDIPDNYKGKVKIICIDLI